MRRDSNALTVHPDHRHAYTLWWGRGVQAHCGPQSQNTHFASSDLPVNIISSVNISYG
jgi:hypothetical protein